MKKIARALLCCLVLGLASCSSGLPSAEDVAAYRDTAKAGYTTAITASNLASILRAGFEPASESEVLIAQKIDIALSNASIALDKAGPWIETGAGEAEGKKALREGLESVLQALIGLSEAGFDVDERKLQAVKLALVVLK